MVPEPSQDCYPLPMIRKTAYTLLCLLLSIAVSAQDVTFYSTENGLSSSLVRQVFEDSNSMIWIATENGLNRYDGSKFTCYLHDPDDPHSVGSDYITSIFEDSRRHLYVCTHVGVQLYDRNTDRFSSVARFTSDGSSSGQVVSIAELSNGEIWAVGNMVSSLSVQGDSLVLNPTSLSSTVNLAEIIREDRNHNIWVVKSGAVYRVHPDGKISTYLEGTTCISSCLYETQEGDIYLTVLNRGLYRYDRKTDDFVFIPYSGNDRFIPKCILPSGGRMLNIGTDGVGIKVYDTVNGTFSQFSQVDGRYDLSKLKVHTMTRDRDGNIWLGIYQKGLAFIPYRRNNFHYYGARTFAGDKIGSCAVSALCRTSDGTMWVGTDNDGIYSLAGDGRDVRHYAPDGSPASVPPVITAMLEDSRGNLWFSSFENSAGILDPRTGRCRYLDLSGLEGPISNYISDLTEDDEGRIWMSTMSSGLLCYDLKTGSLTTSDSFAPNIPQYVTSIEYADHKIYFGTYDGACRLDLENGYGLDVIVPEDIIHTVNIQNDGSIAFGTEMGLVVWSETDGIRQFTIKDGLPSNTVYAVRQDADNMTWLATSNGLSRLREDYSVLVNFFMEDGIQGNEFSRNTSWQDSDGTLWFGGISGLTYFKPSEIVSPQKKWKVRFTEMYLHNQEVTTGTKSGRWQILNSAITDADRINLCHKDNAFTLRFSTVEKNAPKRIAYMYRMDDDEWVTLPQESNRLSFSSLPAKHHILRLKARDSFIDSDEISLEIIVHPPFWATAFAKILYVLFVLAACAAVGLWLLSHYRSKQKLRELEMTDRINEAKLQFFVNISHEIKNPLSMIINPLRKLMTTTATEEERQRNYKIMYRNSEKMLTLMNQLLDVRKIDKGGMKLLFSENDIISFISDIVDNMAEQYQQKNISLSFSHPGLDSLEMWFDSTNLDKVFFNLLSNAYKFTPVNGKVVILLEKCSDKDSDFARISVIDNGIGIKPEDLDSIFKRFYQSTGGQSVYKGGTGVGLDLVRSLVELHNGKIHAENNSSGIGARFVFTLPLGRDHLNDSQIAPFQPRPAAASGLTGKMVLAEAIDVPEAETARSRTKVRLMLVDDDDELRKYVAEELSGDFHIVQFDNGKEALDNIFATKPDIIVSDVVMPVMDGITFCDRIRQNINLNHIPFIMLTGKSKNEDNIAGLKSGADAYIAKPFNIDLLRETIINLLKSRRMLRNNFSGQQNHEDKIDVPDSRNPDEALMERVIRVLNQNISNPDLTIEMLAFEVGISRVHLYRKLKMLTNQTASEFIRNTRLAYSAKLLKDGKHNIGEVATLSGFDNQANFSTAFRKLYGVSPREYKNQPEEQNEASEKDYEKMLNL